MIMERGQESIKRNARGIDGYRARSRIIICLAILSVPWAGWSADTQNQNNRLIIIGVTANAAQELVDQALVAGHEVIGVTRKPDTVKTKHERFTAVYGDAYDVSSIENLLTGDEVVVSYIDIAFPFGPEIPPGVDLFSRGTMNIIEAMKRKGNRRLIVASNMTAQHIVLDKPADDAPLSDRLAWNRRHKYADVRLMETIIEGSELDYIILRLPHLVNAAATGNTNIVVNKNAFNIAVKGQNPSRNLALGDLAAFILKQMNSDEYLETTVGLYN